MKRDRKEKRCKYCGRRLPDGGRDGYPYCDENCEDAKRVLDRPLHWAQVD